MIIDQAKIARKFKELVKDINGISPSEAKYRNSLIKELQAQCQHPNIRPSPAPEHYKAYCPDCGYLDTDYK